MDEPTAADEQQLEEAWSSAGKADLSWCGTKYDSDYVNMGLTGRLEAEDGDTSQTFSLFAGWHTDDFPWPDAERWVSIGLRVGDAGYNYVAYHSGDFSITQPEGHALFNVTFRGTMEAAGSGERVAVEFAMDLDATVLARWELGLGDLGMRYDPAVLKASPGHTGPENTFIKIGETTHPIEAASLIGEVERGHVHNINYRGMFFKYDYCSLLSPETGRSFTSFTTRTLTEEGNLVLENASKLYAKTGSKAFTLDRATDYSREPLCQDDCKPNWTYGHAASTKAVTPDNPEGIACPLYGPEGVLFEHTVDLGRHGSLKRQMYQSISRWGDVYIGLREVFLPKTNVWGFTCSTRYCGDLPASE